MLDRYAARPLAATLLTGAVLATGATGCGSSKSSTGTQAAATTNTTTGTTTATTNTTTGTATGTSTTPSKTSGGPPYTTLAQRYAACLAQNGIKVPTVNGTLSFKGIDTSSAQYRQAVEKCRTIISGGRSSATGSSKANSSAASGRLHSLILRYIACLRQNGVSVPSSDTSGVGSLKGVNTTSPQFKAARTKCESVILSALKAKRSGSASGGH